MTAPIRVGIIGCGEVAQVIHLPTLAQLPDEFTVTALCDVSAAVLDGVGARWNVPAQFRDVHDLLARADIDAVLVANPHVFHADTARAAMAAGKHVLLEKPMCLSLAEADRLMAAETGAGVVVQVGTMRRHAPAFVEACGLVAAMTDIRLARVHDVIGRNALVMHDTSHIVRPADLPETMVSETRARQARGVADAIGEAEPALETAYMMMLGLATHDVSAMREMLGMPKSVLYAAHRADGRFLTAAFDHGGFVCHLEIGVDVVPRFQAYLEVYGGDSVVRVDYDTPYIRNLPARLTVTTARDTFGVAETRGFAARTDAFVEEWRHFHACVTEGRRPKTSLADGRDDLVLFADMVAAMRRGARG